MNSPTRKVSVWAVIPTYNNPATLRDVVIRTLRQQVDGVLVVDDGSDRCDPAALLAGLEGVTLLTHPRNRGKGQALLTALDDLAARGVTYMIALDADGQHYPEDIARFLPVLAEDDCSIVIGCRDFSGGDIPGRSRFGRDFSNFWVRLETGCRVDDAQSGFRAYPVAYLKQLHFLCSRYNFEIEVLTKAAWAGLKLKNLPIRVWYPENPAERVSSFHPFRDNFRLALINFHLVGLRVLPLPRRRLVRDPGEAEAVRHMLRHPLLALKALLLEHATPEGLAAAAGVGAFLAVLPLPGFHTAAIVYAAVRLHLNKVMAINIQHFFMPPLTPLLCLEAGYYVRHGRLLTEVSFDTVCRELGARIVEWWIGAVILAPPLALLTALTVYLAALLVGRWRNA